MEAAAGEDGSDFEIVGLRPGDPRGLVSEHEAHRTLDRGWHYLVKPVADLARLGRRTGPPYGTAATPHTGCRLTSSVS